MSATVIGTIESAKVAQQAIDELLKAGFQDQDVEILEGDEDEIVAVIVERGFDEDDARGYAKAAGRGKTVLAARAVGAKAEKAAAIIERYETAEEGSELEAEETVSEIEENLSVGKSKVASGGVRVTTHVSERPVEQTVTLRDEQVEVEHRSADRKLKPEEAEAAFAGEDGRDARHQRGGQGQQGSARRRRGRARQAGRGAQGDGEGHGSPHRGRGREDQARLSQQALTSLVRDTVGLTIRSVPASLEDRPSATSAGSFLVSGDTCPAAGAEPSGKQQLGALKAEPATGENGYVPAGATRADSMM